MVTLRCKLLNSWRSNAYTKQTDMAVRYTGAEKYSERQIIIDEIEPLTPLT